jgi:hypothetical protein
VITFLFSGNTFLLYGGCVSFFFFKYFKRGDCCLCLILIPFWLTIVSYGEIKEESALLYFAQQDCSCQPSRPSTGSSRDASAQNQGKSLAKQDKPAPALVSPSLVSPSFDSVGVGYSDCCYPIFDPCFDKSSGIIQRMNDRLRSSWWIKQHHTWGQSQAW